MKSFEEALQIIRENAPPLGHESVSLSEAGGRHLASPLIATLDHPPFAQSAMDGWCVRWEDLVGATEDAPIRLLQASGESRAGGAAPPALEPGTAMRIFTGAAMAPQSDAVVVQEDSSAEGRVVALSFAPRLGHHVRSAGASRARGELLALPGARIDAGIIAAAASEGLTRLNVTRAPRVYVLTTGDELTPAGAPLPAGAIYDSNGPMMAELMRSAGATPTLAHVGDSVDEVTAALSTGLDEHDVVVTTGGASVGAHDHVREAMNRCEVREHFWRVAVKPGKPVAFGTRMRRGETVPVIALPGNPVSAFVTFHLFVRPLLHEMMGARSSSWVPVKLAEAYSHRPGREEFIRCKLQRRENELWAIPFSRQNSGALHDLALADVLVRTDGQQEHFAEGTTLEGLVLRLPAAKTRS